MEDDLLRLAKAAAAEAGESLTAFIEAAVRYQLAIREAAAHTDLDLPVFSGTGLKPGVDLDDSAALLDLMEDR